MSAWQPIETAPEGTPILVYQRFYLPGEGYRHFFECGFVINGELVNVEGMNPSHWTPLPEPSAGDAK